jgi:hypothetical protein
MSNLPPQIAVNDWQLFRLANALALRFGVTHGLDAQHTTNPGDLKDDEFKEHESPLIYNWRADGHTYHTD